MRDPALSPKTDQNQSRKSKMAAKKRKKLNRASYVLAKRPACVADSIKPPADDLILPTMPHLPQQCTPLKLLDNAHARPPSPGPSPKPISSKSQNNVSYISLLAMIWANRCHGYSKTANQQAKKRSGAQVKGPKNMGIIVLSLKMPSIFTFN